MAITTAASLAADTYIRLTFTNGIRDDNVLLVAGVLVIGRSGSDTERVQGYNTDVVALTTDSEVVCDSGITSTCSLSICDTPATGVEIRKTEDNQILSIGAIVIFECYLTDIGSLSVQDRIYQQGGSVLTIPVTFAVFADCAETEYLSDWLTYRMHVFLDGVCLEPSPDAFTYTDNVLSVEISDTTTMVDEITYEIYYIAEIENTYGD